VTVVRSGIARRILEDPLARFLLLGGGVFLVYAFVARQGGEREPGAIVVTKGQVEHLVAGFAKTRQRPPTDTELSGLIDDWVREEIATREAVALGLDEGDTVIRRRLRQKLEFVSEDIAAQVEPTDTELRAYLEAHPERFRVEPRFSFSQVYLDPTKHGTNLARDAARVLARLRQDGDGADLAALGDSLLMESTFSSTPASEISKQFGEEFVVALETLAPGHWHGPVESGYGVHLIRVAERTDPAAPALADVRDDVRREWENARRLEGNERFYQELRKRYSITVEGLEGLTAAK
jgi:hypothetical protein